jgi:DnaJ domain
MCPVVARPGQPANGPDCFPGGRCPVYGVGPTHSNELPPRLVIRNRRNPYRLLHVQPDAAPEVIKAAYRALIALHHPDKGGDHALAALINEAYAIVGNADRRAEYDAQRPARHPRQGPSSSSRQSGQQAAPNAAPHASKAPGCPMCDLPLPAMLAPDARCLRCKAPLTPAPHVAAAKPNERRSMPRVSKADWAVLHVDWRADGLDVRMRDLSLDGISVFSGAALPVDRRIRVVGAAFDVVADIVSCRRVNSIFTLHGRLVTAHFAMRAGGFVSTVA